MHLGKHVRTILGVSGMLAYGIVFGEYGLPSLQRILSDEPYAQLILAVCWSPVIFIGVFGVLVGSERNDHTNDSGNNKGLTNNRTTGDTRTERQIMDNGNG